MWQMRNAILGLFGLFMATSGAHTAVTERFLSHPPQRKLPAPSKRPMAKGPALFVDSSRGDDKSDGTEKAPWRTINYALKQLKPGDTLYLRNGVYHENVYCAAAGKKNLPITIRAYPGERAIIDGGLADFFDEPAKAWVPYPHGGADEYRSAKTYKNIRDVLGLFGDSHVALQTYWHAMDLRAKNEFWINDPDKKLMVLPVYCGPGLWYDRASGHIHVRLAHTNLKTPGLANYRGETDPRKIPLIIAPFKSVPLFVDLATHVRFQDLVIRGSGYNGVVLQTGIEIEFDNVTIFAGTYGLRSRSTGPFRMVQSAIHGMIPPWAWRDENSLFTYSPRSYDPFLPSAETANQRNIARLNTHALLVTEGTYEFEVFAYPFNHDWEIANCEFTDGHDGVYLSGRGIRFHHNLVERMQDDGIYLSSPSNYISDDIHIYQNLIRDIFTAFACNNRGGPTGNVFIYRNLVDQRQGVPFSRPTEQKPEGSMPRGHVFLAHGNDLLGIENLHFFQNTFVTETWSGSYAGRTWTVTHPRCKRQIFNNLFVYLNRYPDSATPLEHDIHMDGNLHWCAASGAKAPDDFIDKVRAAKGSKLIPSKYSGGWEANSLVAEPRFVAFDSDVSALNDYRLQPNSPAVGKGVVLPKDILDPLRPKDGARPDIGAFPLGVNPWKFGRQERIALPVSAAFEDAAPLVLVQSGIARCVIVLGSEAPTPAYSARPATLLLQEFLKKVSGAVIPIIPESELKSENAKGKTLILVGDGKRVRELGLSRNGLHPEGFMLKTIDNNLVILGGDERGRQGTKFGVLAFLERSLGIRWLMPFDLGEIVPTQETIALKPFEFRDQPKFLVRHIRNGFDNGALWEAAKPFMGDLKRHRQRVRARKRITQLR